MLVFYINEYLSTKPLKKSFKENILNETFLRLFELKQKWKCKVPFSLNKIIVKKMSGLDDWFQGCA